MVYALINAQIIVLYFLFMIPLDNYYRAKAVAKIAYHVKMDMKIFRILASNVRMKIVNIVHLEYAIYVIQMILLSILRLENVRNVMIIVYYAYLCIQTWI